MSAFVTLIHVARNEVADAAAALLGDIAAAVAKNGGAMNSLRQCADGIKHGKKKIDPESFAGVVLAYLHRIAEEAPGAGARAGDVKARGKAADAFAGAVMADFAQTWATLMDAKAAARAKAKKDNAKAAAKAAATGEGEGEGTDDAAATGRTKGTADALAVVTADRDALAVSLQAVTAERDAMRAMLASVARGDAVDVVELARLAGVEVAEEAEAA